MSEIVYNVSDRRNGWIGPWETEPLDVTKLTAADVGRTVIYRDHARTQAGTLTSWRGDLVFARYDTGDTAAGATAACLVFGIKPADAGHPLQGRTSAAGRLIKTKHDYPPIPDRSLDWSAWYDGDEPSDAGGMDVGHGPTEEAAIADLVENYPDEPVPGPDTFEETFGCEGCTCRMSSTNSASIDPPEPIRDPRCPVHSGYDPDAAYDAMRDGAFDPPETQRFDDEF